MINHRRAGFIQRRAEGDETNALTVQENRAIPMGWPYFFNLITYLFLAFFP
ncbi:hypothetical protein EDWATA_01606 [Edwardsiella tarda ATCC 23685]|uniref:Uncharacterized protein n=1 Tax=Edwardsiella tarda ATCC 23685 TaxID=500638 RepID=D4F4D5_EDWTA|nr:hypothetical protein EDWATA_01606 [Edwardsiella tarda ATCC 23685]